MRSWSRGVLLLTGLLAVGSPAAAQTLEAGALQVRFTGRVQFQYNTSNVPGPEGTFEMRRARQAVRLTIDDWIHGHVEADFALGRLALKNAFMELAPSPGLNVRFGQYKMPFGLIQLTSSTEILTIERGLRIRGLDTQFADEDDGTDPALSQLDGALLMGEEQTLLDAHGYHGYDMGAEVHGTAGPFGYAVGLFNGAGPDRRDANAAKTVAGRVSYALGGTDAPLVLGAAAVFKDR
ncbi:MAG: porin, partial [Gemmatimonadota bacterium]